MVPSIPTSYKSRFLKADRRTSFKVEGGQTYRTLVEQQTRLDDIFILPGATVQVDTAGLAGPLLLLPIVGGALLAGAHAPEEFLAPGYIYTMPALASHALALTNPFEKETVNLLLIQALVPAAASTTVQELQLPLTVKNVLVASENQALPVRVGLYDSRVKGSITPSSPADFALCYVLNGSFEIEDRLVQHRDTLLLWETPEIAFEALSETAILLYLEFSKSF